MGAGFVQSLLWEGRLGVNSEPQLALSESDLTLLTRALAIACDSMPGPPLVGSRDVLAAALAIVYRLGWLILHPEPTPAGDDPTLRMPAAPRSPDDHLAGDVAFRFLPGLYQRIVSRDPESDLAETIKRLLLQWPLSGVLADLREAPETPVEFGGHSGLGFLYAERFAARERSAWMPNGSARECVEVVYHALGKHWEST